MVGRKNQCHFIDNTLMSAAPLIKAAGAAVGGASPVPALGGL